MCKALDIIEKRGIAIGEERGIAIGEERGIAIGEERGITLGEKRGEKRGIMKTLSSLVQDGILTINEAAKRANMSVEKFKMEAGMR